MTETRILKSMAAVGLFLSATACSSNQQASPSQSTTPSSAFTAVVVSGSNITFKGVHLTAPQGWTIVEGSTITTCMPSTANTIVVGDPASTNGDCPAMTPDTKQIWVSNERPDRTAPSQLGPIGELQGWQDNQSNLTTTRWLVVLPKQQIEISFVGDVDAQRQQVVQSISAA